MLKEIVYQGQQPASQLPQILNKFCETDWHTELFAIGRILLAYTHVVYANHLHVVSLTPGKLMYSCL
jgi:hypothetical protein